MTMPPSHLHLRGSIGANEATGSAYQRFPQLTDAEPGDHRRARGRQCAGCQFAL
jgi:hypothetical protein